MTGAVGSISPALSGSADVADSSVSVSEHAWIVRLIRDEGPAILRLLWRLLGSEPDVMDAYQDCFCNLAARSGKVDLASAKAYAYRTATNIAIEMIRIRCRRRAHWPAIVRQWNDSQTEAAERGPESPERLDGRGQLGRAPAPTASGDCLAPGVDVERLREAVVQLPPHLRNVIVLRDFSRLSYNEVGRTLGIEPATARVYRRHAVVKLADMLGEEMAS